MTSWMPGYLTEVLSLPSALSAAISAFMPLFSVAIVYLAMVMILTWIVGRLERRLRKNER